MEKLEFLEPVESQEAELPVEVIEPIAEAIEQPVEQPKQEAIPLPVFLDMRDKLKAAEARVAEAEAKVAPAQQHSVPDMYEDPEGYQAWQVSLSQQMAQNAKLDVSEEMARDKFGDEVVDTARDWALEMSQKRPGFGDEILRQRHPYKYVVEQYQREQIASNVNAGDYEEFKAWKAAQLAVTQPTIEQLSVPTPSMVATPSAGGVAHVPTGPGQAFDQLFRK